MSAMAGLLPLPLLAAGSPPVAIKYSALSSLGPSDSLY